MLIKYKTLNTHIPNFLNALFIPKANGRFEVGKKICLSISGHHPETWQPSWSSEYLQWIQVLQNSSQLINNKI